MVNHLLARFVVFVAVFSVLLAAAVAAGLVR